MYSSAELQTANSSDSITEALGRFQHNEPVKLSMMWQRPLEEPEAMEEEDRNIYYI